MAEIYEIPLNLVWLDLVTKIASIATTLALTLILLRTYMQRKGSESSKVARNLALTLGIYCASSVTGTLHATVLMQEGYLVFRESLWAASTGILLAYGSLAILFFASDVFELFTQSTQKKIVVIDTLVTVGLTIAGLITYATGGDLNPYAIAVAFLAVISYMITLGGYYRSFRRIKERANVDEIRKFSAMGKGLVITFISVVLMMGDRLLQVSSYTWISPIAWVLFSVGILFFYIAFKKK